jgi:hypothetical protein
MTDKPDPNINEILDLDAFLIEDSRIGPACKGLAADTISPEIEQLPVRNSSQVNRLCHRVVHATKNITTALNDAHQFKIIINDDLETCTQIDEDLNKWADVIGSLEETLKHLPDSNNPDEDDSLHEEISDIFSAQLGSPAVQNTAEDVCGEDTFIGKDNLRQSLEERDSRIRELEDQLAALQQPTDQIEATETEAKEDSLISPYVNRLIVINNGTENLKFPITQNIMTIGRDPRNDIHVRSRYISRFQARIVSDKAGSIIEDLDSRNGVTVNSKRVQRAQLQSGDLIGLGKVHVQFIDLMEGSADEGNA